MPPIIDELIQRYWSASEIVTNLLVFTNIFGALLLGLLVGYERTYHGRAAGMRTYGIVCMASCALTVIAGYPQFWFGGQVLNSGTIPDPTRVVQGIVTGVGFLGAGVIMKDGFNISGLTTAASIWASSAIGVMVGVGFYAAAILLSILSAALMMWAARLELWLPTRPAIALMLRFKPGFKAQQETLVRVARERGYEVALGSISVRHVGGRQEWRYVAIEFKSGGGTSLTQLASELELFEGVEEFELSHARN
ncbi:MAG: MgtC/SapB family protein [Rhodocyclales bacterium]|nr:MgtC/SapB family protein [Rhodocyclales bacterium]